MNAQNVATSLIMCGAFFCFKRKSYVFCRATQCLETPSQDFKNFFAGYSLAENGVDASAPQHLIHSVIAVGVEMTRSICAAEAQDSGLQRG